MQTRIINDNGSPLTIKWRFEGDSTTLENRKQKTRREHSPCQAQWRQSASGVRSLQTIYMPSQGTMSLLEFVWNTPSTSGKTFVDPVAQLLASTGGHNAPNITSTNIFFGCDSGYDKSSPVSNSHRTRRVTQTYLTSLALKPTYHYPPASYSTTTILETIPFLVPDH